MAGLNLWAHPGDCGSRRDSGGLDDGRLAGMIGDRVWVCIRMMTLRWFLACLGGAGMERFLLARGPTRDVCASGGADLSAGLRRNQTAEILNAAMHKIHHVNNFRKHARTP